MCVSSAGTWTIGSESPGNVRRLGSTFATHSVLISPWCRRRCRRRTSRRHTVRLTTPIGAQVGFCGRRAAPRSDDSRAPVGPSCAGLPEGATGGCASREPSRRVRCCRRPRFQRSVSLHGSQPVWAVGVRPWGEDHVRVHQEAPHAVGPHRDPGRFTAAPRDNRGDVNVTTQGAKSGEPAARHRMRQQHCLRGFALGILLTACPHP